MPPRTAHRPKPLTKSRKPTPKKPKRSLRTPPKNRRCRKLGDSPRPELRGTAALPRRYLLPFLTRLGKPYRVLPFAVFHGVLALPHVIHPCTDFFTDAFL